MRRTHGRCARCGAPAVLAHHIVAREHGGTDTAENLEPLCDRCHRHAHGYSAAPQRPVSAASTYPHTVRQ